MPWYPTDAQFADHPKPYYDYGGDIDKWPSYAINVSDISSAGYRTFEKQRDDDIGLVMTNHWFYVLVVWQIEYCGSYDRFTNY